MDTNHRTRWTQEENTLLESLWDPTAVPVLAELFGRTDDAVRQRHYELTWGTAPKAASAKELIEGRSSGQGCRLEVVRPLGATCQGCNMELPATEVCDWC